MESQRSHTRWGPLCPLCWHSAAEIHTDFETTCHSIIWSLLFLYRDIKVKLRRYKIQLRGLSPLLLPRGYGTTGTSTLSFNHHQGVHYLQQYVTHHTEIIQILNQQSTHGFRMRVTYCLRGKQGRISRKPQVCSRKWNSDSQGGNFAFHEYLSASLLTTSSTWTCCLSSTSWCAIQMGIWSVGFAYLLYCRSVNFKEENKNISVWLKAVHNKCDWLTFHILQTDWQEQ